MPPPFSLRSSTKCILVSAVRLLRTKTFYILLGLAFFEYFFYGLGQQQSQKASAEAKLKKGGGYKRVTIDDLMAKKELSFDSLAKLPNRDLSRTEEKTAFTYKRVKCPRINKIEGDSTIFGLCWPNRAGETNRLAYFINVNRDFRFESNFKKLVGNDVKLKIFTKYKPLKEVSLVPAADFVKYIDVKIYTERVDDQEMGIKDLIDLHDDYHLMEFMMYEMANVTDPMVFSVNIPVFSAHILLRLDHFDYEEVRYVVKRLNYATYYPYSVEFNADRTVMFIAFLHKHHLSKYDAATITESVWQKDGGHTGF